MLGVCCFIRDTFSSSSVSWNRCVCVCVLVLALQSKNADTKSWRTYVLMIKSEERSEWTRACDELMWAPKLRSYKYTLQNYYYSYLRDQHQWNTWTFSHLMSVWGEGGQSQILLWMMSLLECSKHDTFIHEGKRADWKTQNFHVIIYAICVCAAAHTEDINQKYNSKNCHRLQNIKFIMHGDVIFFMNANGRSA